MSATHRHRMLVLAIVLSALWLSPVKARYLQVDPVGYDDQINLYAYVANDPINMTDPTGAARCSHDSRCEEVHTAAAEARAIAQRGASDLRNLAQAVKSGGELNESQAGLLAAFERKFGSGSESTINRVAGRLERIAEGIGERGEGMRIRFGGTRGTEIASTQIGGNTMTIRPSFFTMSGSRSLVILHDAGHGPGGLRDRRLPADAPLGVGFEVGGVRRAYGPRAADWLGRHHPGEAARNNDNYVCLVHGACSD